MEEGKESQESPQAQPVRKMVEYYIESTSEEESSEDEDEGTEATLTAAEEDVEDLRGIGEEEERRRRGAGEKGEEIDVEGYEGEEEKERGDVEVTPFGDFGESLSGLGMAESEGFHLYDRDDQELMEVDIEDLSSPMGSLSPSWTDPNADTTINTAGGGSKLVEEGGHEEGVGESVLQVGTTESEEVGTTKNLSCTETFPEGKEALKSNITETQSQGVETFEQRSTVSHPSKHPNRLYCFCQQPALNYFMIQCHRCRKWFHGSCVGITRHSAARVKEFYCSVCIDEDLSLVTVFHSDNKAKEEEEEEEGEKSKPKCRAHDGGKRSTAKKHSRRCGSCAACLREDDCKKCRFCKDMPKYGGLGRMRQKCIKRQCHKLSRILYAEDPLHSKSRKLQEDIAAELRKVGGRVELTSTSDGEGEPVGDKSDIMSEEEVSKSARASEEGDISYAPKTSTAKAKHRGRKKPGKRLRRGIGRGGSRAIARGNGGGGRVRLSASDLEIITQEQPILRRRGRRAFADVLLHGTTAVRDMAPVQCLGPGCLFAARPHSKYCSEECGIQLAIRRIKSLLPETQKWWDSESGDGGDDGEGGEGGGGEDRGEGEEGGEGRRRSASTLSNIKLQELDKEQKDIRAQLEELDKQTLSIDRHVDRMASVTPSAEDESFETDDDLTIFCATCGQPTGIKKAIVHMERCFSKMEGVVSFGSLVKSEGTNIFCDKFDAAQQTYCKRLRVLCPEHTKEPKIGPKDVCGCPLDPLFPSQHPTSPTFCRQPKRSCTKHYSWEKVRRAEIDQEKLNLFLKLEDVGDQIRMQEWHVQHSGSLMARLLHHTIDHSRERGGREEEGGEGEGGGEGREDGEGERGGEEKRDNKEGTVETESL